MMHKNSKIFVAGGTGLVGSAILKNLLAKGYTNLITNYHTRPFSFTDERLRVCKLDLLDSNAVEAFYENEKPEYVFLAAARVGGIIANNKYRADFIYENLQIQNNVIYESFRHRVQKLMFLGSTCIYPKNAAQPMREEELLSGELEYTNEPYAIAKIAGIKMCESYNLQYGTNYISVMPTNLYGPHDNFDLEKSHVLPALIRKIHLGKALESGDWITLRQDLDWLPIENVDGSASDEKILSILENYGIRKSSDAGSKGSAVTIEIWGSGQPLREFLWSEDMADACVYLMENVDFEDIVRQTTPLDEFFTENNSQSTIRNTHINIGTGKEISIAGLAEKIAEVIGFRGKFYFNSNKPDGTMRKVTDPSRLHRLGWHHHVELDEGITRMYAWYLSQV